MFKSVLLYTNKLKSMKRFYANVLRLDIKKSTDDYFIVNVGETDITFKQSNEPSFYHFAINIPGNQFVIMKDWIEGRINLIRINGKSEIYYKNLGADSMYFEDPAGNLVELIGRRNRDFFGSLTKEAFYDVSEIGITTPQMFEVGEELQDMGLALKQRTEVDMNLMNYLGRDDTYIVLVPPEWEWEFSEKSAETHPLEITFNDGQHIAMDKKGKITITEVETED